jgi:hypothetical protein
MDSMKDSRHGTAISIGAPTRLDALSAEFAFAIRQSNARDLGDIAEHACRDLGSALTRRAGNVFDTARKLTSATTSEVKAGVQAWQNNRLIEHTGIRRKAAVDGAANKYRAGKEFGSQLVSAVREAPADNLPKFVVTVIAGLAASGGVDGDGGVPDMDLLAGIGYHRSPFTHSIVAGAVLETAVLTLIRVVEKLHDRLPETHDPVWDEFQKHSTSVLDAAGRGASVGIAYHLLVDGIAQPGAYHGLPVEMPIEAHQGLFVLNAGAEAQDAVVRPKTREQLRTEHRELLTHPFHMTANVRRQLPAEQVSELHQCGSLLAALADGRTSPYTPQQRQFVEVANGTKAAERLVEHAWLAYVRALENARA